MKSIYFYKYSMIIKVSFVILVLTACSSGGKDTGAENKKKTYLFNGQDLSGLTPFLKDSAINTDKVFQVKKDSVLHISGDPFGYLQTDEDFSDYKLHVEWRWVNKAGNSGVFLHKNGPDQIWPETIEAQLMAGNAGDIVCLGGTRVKEKPDSSVVVKKIKESTEKPTGEWNIYQITCFKDSIKLVVNGVLQNKVSNASNTSGKIGFQSEGAPIEMRNIYIEEL